MSTNKKATVTHALEKHTARRERARIVELFGTLEWDDSVDHKEDRRSRSQARFERLTGPASDTSVWSLAFRRDAPQGTPEVVVL